MNEETRRRKADVTPERSGNNFSTVPAELATIRDDDDDDDYDDDDDHDNDDDDYNCDGDDNGNY